MAACSVLKIIMRWGSVSAVHSRMGALSMDINRSDTQFDNQHSFHGYQWRTQYIKDIPETNTNIAVSYYRYTNDGYFSFDEATAELGL